MNEELEVKNTEVTEVTAEHTIPAKISETDLKNNQLHKDVIREENEQDFDVSTLDGKSLEELLEEARNLLIQTPKVASVRIKLLRDIFTRKYAAAKKEAQEMYEAQKTDETLAFEFEKEPLTLLLKTIEIEIKQAREEEKKRIEGEKQKNLARKEALIAQLQNVVTADETDQTIAEVKDIQKEWKGIRVLPKESINGLWERYNMLLNTFYDNHSINLELKELDRQKNLEAKIELTKKMESILEEKSLKRSFILLNKLHEEFKNIGPVPPESREPIWNAFKSASDAVYEDKRKIFEALESEKETNLQKKQILCEKADLLNAVYPKDLKGWNEKAKAFDDLFSDWKKIGALPKSNKDAAWIQFNGVRNDFYIHRKAFFKELNSGRNENLKAKQLVCEQVEALKDSTDWVATSKSIITLQANWKKIGPVPEKINQAIWKRFRSACDHFFAAKNEALSGKREEEIENLKQKEALVQSLKDLAQKEEEHKSAFEKLKQINAEWRTIGFVPLKDVKRISKAYDKANGAVYAKYSSQIEAAKAANLGDHYKQIKEASPNGIKELEYEEQNIKRKITLLNEEISSIERNMSFFAKSKTADKMLKDFNNKIEKAKKQIDRLKKELGVIRNAKRADKTPDAADTAAPNSES